MGIVGNLAPQQRQSFDDRGFIVIESFASTEEIEAMRKRMDELLQDFDPTTTASIFSTKNQLKLTNEYFYESAEKISFFFEEKAFDDKGNLKQSKELSINKVGACAT
ncbi:Phytanoyl-CoA dioxygenase [Hibiscus syriacus]|uniref:Phytanoyl-CoA dioxygenase n=1 Tax=Hibiscus syriacus TaxID=106335 RepID=A0A6A3BQQ1_HIBSY|nr:phytanoyl-CoA dioxygenase-like [Hibiscus syriacus]XP_039065970.1 phytanoyl-CoA dioxygenase-like [Hibiscus syriacus]KAE8719270.1 Phytanoyl-CoA dioxygenase [Hibiscus syriacus]